MKFDEIKSYCKGTTQLETILTVRVSPEDKAKLDAIVQAEHRSLSEVARAVLLSGLSRLES